MTTKKPAAPPSPEKCRRAQYHSEVAICGICHYQAAAPQSSPLPTDKKGVRGEGFNHATGGFARVWIDGISYDASEVVRRMSRCQAFDTMVRALERLAETSQWSVSSGANETAQMRANFNHALEAAYAALDLAQEVK